MVHNIQNYYEISDMNKFVKIISKQMKFIGSNNDPERIKAAIKNALMKNKRTIFFVKINEIMEYCGFAFCNICSGLETGADYLWINELYVESEYRRKGCASEIMNFIENWSIKNGIELIVTTTGKKNKTAMSFYKSKGYKLSKTVWVEKSIE